MLIKAILKVFAGVVIYSTTHYTASKVIEKLKKDQNSIKYYSADIYNNDVYLSSAIKSKRDAVNRLKYGEMFLLYPLNMPMITVKKTK